MDQTQVLKALADETRMNILNLLLCHSHCVGALARKLEISEAAVSQHLKILREAGLIIGEKKGYFMHYDVDKTVLHELAGKIEALAAVEREASTPEQQRCKMESGQACRHAGAQPCSDTGREPCHANAHQHHNGRPSSCNHYRKDEE